MRLMNDVRSESWGAHVGFKKKARPSAGSLHCGVLSSEKESIVNVAHIQLQLISLYVIGAIGVFTRSY